MAASLYHYNIKAQLKCLPFYIPPVILDQTLVVVGWCYVCHDSHLVELCAVLRWPFLKMVRSACISTVLGS